MTDKELEKIKNLLNAASKGPWKLYRQVQSGEGLVKTSDYYMTEPINDKGGRYFIGMKTFSLEQTTPEDDKFIVHTRNDVPLLLDEIHKLKHGENPSIADEVLKEIERRCNAAAPSTWIVYFEGRDVWGGENIIDTGIGNIHLGWASVEDYDFIADARQSIPALLEEISRLKKINK